jgi:hypothetical protein
VAGLAVLSGLLLAAWAGLLARTMRRPARRAPRAARGPVPRGCRRPPGGLAVAAGHPDRRRRRQGAARLAARQGRTLLLLMALLISGLNLAVPAVAFSAPALLPFFGLGRP